MVELDSIQGIAYARPHKTTPRVSTVYKQAKKYLLKPLRSSKIITDTFEPPTYGQHYLPNNPQELRDLAGRLKSR